MLLIYFILGRINILINWFVKIWSVMFHSWLGFVMLMMANVMWLIPRQSLLMKLMVRFVSIYMSCRVTVTYFVSLSYDFPDSMFGFQMQQFGLVYDYQLEQLPILMQVTVILYN